MKKFILLSVAITALPFTGCRWFWTKPPEKPTEVLVSTKKVDHSVELAIGSLQKQMNSLQTVEERIQFAIEMSKQIEELTKTKDEDFLHSPVVTPTPLP